MGLSNEERRAMMLWAIHRLDQTRHNELGDPAPYAGAIGTVALIHRLSSAIGRLWHAAFGGTSNGAFWFLGGEADNPIRREAGPWSVAVASHCAEHRNEKGALKIRRGPGAPFDPFDGFLDVNGLLAQARDGKVLAGVHTAYQQTEALSYAVRRYDDDMRRGLVDVDRLISEIMGVCFSIFAIEQAFARAYVLNRVFKWLYTGNVSSDPVFYAPEADPVAGILLQLDMHHDMSRLMTHGSLAEIIKLDEWRLRRAPTPGARLEAALRLAGARFHYEHQFRALEKAAADLQPAPDIARLRRLFANNIAAKKAAEAEERPRHAEEDAAEAAHVVHGYDGYTWAQQQVRKAALSKKPSTSRPE